MNDLILRTADQAGQAQGAGGDMMGFMTIINFFIGIYVLYYAFKGKGKIYENDYPTAMKEDYAQMLRKFCWIVGIGMIVFSILEYTNKEMSIWVYLGMGFVLTCVVVFYVLFRIRFKQYLKTDKPAKAEKKKKL